MNGLHSILFQFEGDAEPYLVFCITFDRNTPLGREYGIAHDHLQFDKEDEIMNKMFTGYKEDDIGWVFDTTGVDEKDIKNNIAKQLKAENADLLRYEFVAKGEQ